VGVWEKSESKNYIPFGDVVKNNPPAKQIDRQAFSVRLFLKGFCVPLQLHIHSFCWECIK
jgi:hypothetical protein